MQFSALLIACGLALLALAYVLYPLYRGRLAKTVPVSPLSAQIVQPATSDSEQTARLALQEVELDYQLGNIAESDYRTLRERYMRRALVAMKSRYDNAPTGTGHDEDENAQDTENTYDKQDERDEGDADIDALIEEQLREMRQAHRGGNDAVE